MSESVRKKKSANQERGRERKRPINTERKLNLSGQSKPPKQRIDEKTKQPAKKKKLGNKKGAAGRKRERVREEEAGLFASLKERLVNRPQTYKQKEEPEEEVSKRETILEIIRFIVPILLMAAIAFLFIFKTSPHLIDGNSMNPTLQNGDRVIVLRTKNPSRYEMITFDPPVKSEFKYVKRVIGMPGDAIWVNGTDLFINEAEKLPEGAVVTNTNELPENTIKVSLSQKALEQLSKFEEIPKGFYFVLGDNRNNSSDSRDFGLVADKSIEGVVAFRFSPFGSTGWVK